MASAADRSSLQRRRAELAHCFHHYRKWSAKDEWQKVWTRILGRNIIVLDLSIAHINSSHTSEYRGGEKVEYQARKKRFTTNALFLSVHQGIPLSMAEPQLGNHADLYEIEERIDEKVSQLSETRHTFGWTFL